MGKKDKDRSNFSKMLKENQKVIRVATKDDFISLADATENTISKIVASPLDGVIPVSSTEAAENALQGCKLNISTAYAQNVFSMYEFSLKYRATKQTLIIPVHEDDLEDIWDAKYAGYGPLKDRSNLKLVLDKFPEKAKKKVANWAKEDDAPAIFVIRIPDLIVFHGDIKKNEVSKSTEFDIIIEIIRSGKSLSKLKKKRPEDFDTLSNFFVTSTVKVLKDFGVSCVHIPLVKDLYDDPHNYARSWVKALSEDKNLVSRVIFCTSDPDELVSFNQQLMEDVLNLAGVDIM